MLILKAFKFSYILLNFKRSGRGSRYNHNWVSAEKGLKMLQTLKRCANWSLKIFNVHAFKTLKRSGGGGRYV